jgi:hypothetical protein
MRVGIARRGNGFDVRCETLESAAEEKRAYKFRGCTAAKWLGKRGTRVGFTVWQIMLLWLSLTSQPKTAGLPQLRHV